MKKVNMKKTVLGGCILALVLLPLLGIAEAKLNLDCQFKVSQRMGGMWEPVPVGTPGRTQDGNIWIDEVVWNNVGWCEPLAFALMPFLPLLILSLITYKMSDMVFRSWWNFARWWVPVIAVSTLLLNNKGSGGGYLGMDTMFDGLVYSILYGVLVIVSLVKIVRAYGKK